MDEGFGDATQGALPRYRQSFDDATARANREILMDALDRLAAGDENAVWSILDEGVRFHEAGSLPYGGVHEGIVATKAAFAQMDSLYAGMRSEMEAVLAAGDLAMLYQTITFEVRANGNTGTLPVCEVFRFRDGKVIEWRAMYFDAALVAKALAGA